LQREFNHAGIADSRIQHAIRVRFSRRDRAIFDRVIRGIGGPFGGWRHDYPDYREGFEVR
jgi:hypothetical protein